MSRSRRNAAYFCIELPWPLDGGAKLRTYQTLSALAASFDTTLVCLREPSIGVDVEASLKSTAPGLVDVRSVEGLVRIRRRPGRFALALARSFARREAYSVAKFWLKSLEDALVHTLRSRAPACLYIGGTQLDPIARRAIRRAQWSGRVAVEAHNVESDLWSTCEPLVGRAQRAFIRREARLLLPVEKRAWAAADLVVCICDEDAALVRASGSIHAHVAPVALPPSHASRLPRIPRGAPTFGAIGNWGWPPNRLSLEWFVRTALPALRHMGISEPFVLAGHKIPRSVRRVSAELAIDARGYVADVDELYAGLDVIVAPDIAGGGVRLKVLKAMQAGCAVVGTPIAFRGIPHEDAVDCLVARDPEELAAATARLLRSPEEVRRLGARAFRRLEVAPPANETAAAIFAELLS